MKISIPLFILLLNLLALNHAYNITTMAVNDTISLQNDHDCREFDDKSIFVRACASSTMIFIEPLRKAYHINHTNNVTQIGGTCYSKADGSEFVIIVKRADLFHYFVLFNGRELEDYTFRVIQLQVPHQNMFYRDDPNPRILFIHGHLVIRRGINRYISYSYEELYFSCKNRTEGKVPLLNFKIVHGISEHMAHITHIQTSYIFLWSFESMLSLDYTNQAIIINRFGEDPTDKSLIVTSQEFYSVDWNRLSGQCWKNLGVLQDPHSNFLVIQCFIDKRTYMINLNPFMLLSYDSAGDYQVIGFSHSLSHFDQKHRSFSTSLFFFKYQNSYYLRQYSSLEKPLRFNISDSYPVNVFGTLISVLPSKKSESKLLLIYTKPDERDIYYIKEEIVPEVLLRTEQGIKDSSNPSYCTENKHLCFSNNSQEIESRFIYDSKHIINSNSTTNLTAVNKYEFQNHMSCYRSLVELHCQEIKAYSGSKMDEKLCNECLKGQDSCFNYNPVYFALLKKNCEVLKGSLSINAAQRECVPSMWTIGNSSSVHGTRVTFENSTDSARDLPACSYVLRLGNKNQGSTLVMNFLIPNSKNFSLAFNFKKLSENSSAETLELVVNTTGTRVFSIDDTYDAVQFNFTGISYVEFELLQYPQLLHQNFTDQIVCTLCKTYADPGHLGTACQKYLPPVESNRSDECPHTFENQFCYLAHHKDSRRYDVMFNEFYVLPTCKVQISLTESAAVAIFNISEGETVSISTDNGDTYTDYYVPQSEYREIFFEKPGNVSFSTPWNITVIYSSKNPQSVLAKQYQMFKAVVAIAYGSRTSTYWMIVMVLMCIFITSSVIINIALLFARRVLRRNFIIPVSAQRLNPYDIANKREFHEMQVTLLASERARLEEEGYRVTDVGNPVSLEHLDCVLCLEAVEMKEHQIFLCGRHYVHVDCFKEWLGKSIDLGKNDLCPMRCSDILVKTETRSTPKERTATEESQELLSK